MFKLWKAAAALVRWSILRSASNRFAQQIYLIIGLPVLVAVQKWFRWMASGYFALALLITPNGDVDKLPERSCGEGRAAKWKH